MLAGPDPPVSFQAGPHGTTATRLVAQRLDDILKTVLWGSIQPSIPDESALIGGTADFVRHWATAGIRSSESSAAVDHPSKRHRCSCAETLQGNPVRIPWAFEFLASAELGEYGQPREWSVGTLRRRKVKPFSVD